MACDRDEKQCVCERAYGKATRKTAESAAALTVARESMLNTRSRVMEVRSGVLRYRFFFVSVVAFFPFWRACVHTNPPCAGAATFSIMAKREKVSERYTSTPSHLGARMHVAFLPPFPDASVSCWVC